MTTDRELLELAAKAAGIDVRWHEAWECFVHVGEWANGRPLMHRNQMHWGPLDDDGDALRLAVKLNLLIMPHPEDSTVRVVEFNGPKNTVVSWGTPPDALDATRRAIVQAAAEIGKGMP